MLNVEAARLDLLSRHLAADLQVAAENAVLMAYQAVGRGDKNLVDFLASDAIRGSLFIDRRQAVVINGEGQKDGAPGIFRGETLGNPDVPCDYTLGLAIDPIDGTGNAAAGRPNSGCYISGILTLDKTIDPYSLMPHLPADRCWKLAVGSHAAHPMPIDPEASVAEILRVMAFNTRKKITELNVVVLHRDYNAELIEQLRAVGCEPQLITDGDIAPIVAACFPHHKVDAYIGIGGTPELQIAVSAVYNMRGRLWARQWAKTPAEKEREGYHERLLSMKDLMLTNGATRTFFVAAGLTRSDLLNPVRKTRHHMVTDSITVRGRSRTIRKGRGTEHDLKDKRIFMYSLMEEVGLDRV